MSRTKALALASILLTLCTIAFAGNQITGYDNDAYANWYIAQANSAASGTITAGTPLTIGGTATAGLLQDFTMSSTANGGEATYNGPGGTFEISVGISMSTTASNIDTMFYVALNGTAEVDKTEAIRFISSGAGSQIGRAATCWLGTLSTGDTIKVFADIASGTATYTAETLQVCITQVGH